MTDNKGVQIGDEIQIIQMKGEPQYTGKVGTVVSVDSIGQIHGTWGGCALNDEDTFIITKKQETKI